MKLLIWLINLNILKRDFELNLYPKIEIKKKKEKEKQKINLKKKKKMRSFTQVLGGRLLRSFMEVDILGKDSETELKVKNGTNNKTCKKIIQIAYKRRKQCILCS